VCDGSNSVAVRDHRGQHGPVTDEVKKILLTAVQSRYSFPEDFSFQPRQGTKQRRRCEAALQEGKHGAFIHPQMWLNKCVWCIHLDIETLIYRVRTADNKKERGRSRSKGKHRNDSSDSSSESDSDDSGDDSDSVNDESDETSRKKQRREKKKEKKKQRKIEKKAKRDAKKAAKMEAKAAKIARKEEKRQAKLNKRMEKLKRTTSIYQSIFPVYNAA
jgi:flagellar biosynthesis GTPase FlhF